MTRDEAQSKQVVNEACNIVKNCKMIVYVPTFAKHVDEEDQHGGKAYFKS
jgi:hypothetical protein